MRHTLRLVLALGLGLSLSNFAFADGVFFDGLTARSIGRGGTNLAQNDNGAVLHDNVSAIANIDGDVMFEVGSTMLFTDVSYSDPQNPTTSVSQLYAMPEFSLIKKSRDGDWAYGIGVFSPAGFGSRFYLEGPPSLPGEHLYKSFATLGRILPGAAYKVTDRLSVGATLGVAVLVADLEGPYTLQTSLPGTPTLIDLDAGGAALSWSVGVSYELTEDTSIGFNYQSENRFKAHGTTSVTVPGLGSTDYQTRLNMTWPQSFGAGIRHELCPHRIISLDLVWYDWSSAFDTIGLDLSSSSNPFFPALNEQMPLRWRDSLSTRIGYEMKFANDRTLRFGYVHHRLPMRAGTMTPYIPAALENGVTTGYGFKVFAWNLDLSYMFSWGPTVDTNTSDFVGGDFDDSQNTDRVHAFTITLMRTW